MWLWKSLSFPVLSHLSFTGRDEIWDLSWCSPDPFRRSSPVDRLWLRHMMASSAWCGWLMAPAVRVLLGGTGRLFGSDGGRSSFGETVSSWLRWLDLPSVMSLALSMANHLLLYWCRFFLRVFSGIWLFACALLFAPISSDLFNWLIRDWLKVIGTLHL